MEEMSLKDFFRDVPCENKVKFDRRAKVMEEQLTGSRSTNSGTSQRRLCTLSAGRRMGGGQG